MLDQGNGQLSAVGFFNPLLGGGDPVVAYGGGCDTVRCFDMSGGKIVNCALVFGRQWLKCGDTEIAAISDPGGVIYAEVTHTSTSPSLAVKHTSDQDLPENSLEKSYRALYYAATYGDGAKVWVDVRYQPALFAMN